MSRGVSPSLTGSSVTVIGRRWDPVRLRYVADYRCDYCGHEFHRAFNDAYPKWCPMCRSRLYAVNGDMARRRTWRR